MVLFELGTGRRVSAYGIDRDAKPTTDELGVPTPTPLAELYRELVSFADADAVPWQPDELQVSMYKPASYRGPRHAWPEWLPRPPVDARHAPPIEHADSVDDVARIFYRIGPEHEDALARLDPTPIELDGEVWYLHFNRVPPAEL